MSPAAQSRALTFLIALVCALAAILMGATSASAAAVPTSATVGVRVCDVHPQSASMTDTVTARGSPGYDPSGTTDDAVDYGSHGASARSATATSPAITTYDRTTALVQIARTAGTTDRIAQVTDGNSVVFEPTGGAANKGDDLVDVWRVVGPDEAADIARTGGYRVQPGGEGKYFFPTSGQAENLGQMYNKANWPGPQTLTGGQVPRSVIARAESVNAGTEGPGWFIRSPDIPNICNVQCLGIIP